MYLGNVVEYGPTGTLFQKLLLQETQDYVTGRFGYFNTRVGLRDAHQRVTEIYPIWWAMPTLRLDLMRKAM
jgi:hypothetical protein